MNTIRCVLIDDHEFACDSLARELRTLDDIDLIGCATELERALGDFDEPDVVLLDLSLPGICRRETIPTVLAAWPNSRVIAMTVYDTGPDLVLSISEGADGYIKSNTPTDELADVLRRVAHGATHYAPIPITYHRDTGIALTPIDRAVLRHLALGYTDVQIAAALDYTPRWVAKQLATIRGKAALPDSRARALLTRFALEHDPYCPLAVDEHITAPRPLAAAPRARATSNKSSRSHHRSDVTCSVASLVRNGRPSDDIKYGI